MKNIRNFLMMFVFFGFVACSGGGNTDTESKCSDECKKECCSEQSDSLDTDTTKVEEKKECCGGEGEACCSGADGEAHDHADGEAHDHTDNADNQ